MAYAPYFAFCPRATLRTFYPGELMQLYNVPNVPKPASRVEVAVISFGGGLVGSLGANGVITGGDCQAYWIARDLPEIPTLRAMVLPGATWNPNSDATVENTIDVQTIGCLCPWANITLIVAPNTNDSFVQVLEAAWALKPKIVSCSWGGAETSDAGQYVRSVENVLQRFAQAGITVCCASGDNGSSDGVNDGKAHCDHPASSPSVLACGGTRLVAESNNVYDASTQEYVWNNDPKRSATGGGVSQFFAKPAYQSKITLSNMRMAPDVALNGDPATGVKYLIHGSEQSVGGTSIVAPFVAGYLARIGCDRFATPLLYAADAKCFHDILVGDNGAYKATQGFDLASGLGSFDGTLLQAYLTESSSSVPTQPSDPPLSPPTKVHSLQVFPCLSVGQRMTFAIATLPTALANRDVKWTSSNASVATVDSYGTVSGLSAGSTIVTVATTDGRLHKTVTLLVV